MKKLPLVINIRGNSGSGKTHLTREFMALCRPVFSYPIARVQEDQLLLYGKQKWAVLGRYTAACGGCDGIHSQQEIINRVERYTAQGMNVWLEGLLVGSIYGAVGAYSERFGDRWVFAYLDTPFELCIARIKARRAAKGTAAPLNEQRTARRVRELEHNRATVQRKGRRVLTLPHDAALGPLLKIIKKEAL